MRSSRDMSAQTITGPTNKLAMLNDFTWQHDILHSIFRLYYVLKHRAPVAYLPILVVYGQMPIKLYGAGQCAQGLLQDTGPSVHPFVGLWQCLSSSSYIKEQILTLLRVRGTLVHYNPVQLTWAKYN